MKNSLTIIQNEDPKLPWYGKGLRFECTGCGKCCTGAPGVVFVSEEEIENIATYLKLNIKDIYIRYIRRVNGKLALVELSKNYDCIFLKDNKCTIYPVRPKQCKTFPWWPQNLSSEKDWQEASIYCEGIRNEAPIVPYSTIQTELEIQIGK